MAVSSDMGTKNVSFWNLCGVHAKKDGSINNMFSSNGHQVFVTPDVCHLLKNLKAAMLSQNIVLPNEIVTANNLPSNIVSGEIIKQLFNAELKAKKPLRTFHHLIREDIEPDNFEKMNVGAAVRFFSDQTAVGLELAIHLNILPQTASSTAWFIREIKLWFELVSARARNVGINH